MEAGSLRSFPWRTCVLPHSLPSNKNWLLPPLRRGLGLAHPGSPLAVLPAFRASLTAPPPQRREYSSCVYIWGFWGFFSLFLVHWVLHHVLLPLVPLPHMLLWIWGWEWEYLWNRIPRIMESELIVTPKLRGSSSKNPPRTSECCPNVLAGLVHWAPWGAWPPSGEENHLPVPILDLPWHTSCCSLRSCHQREGSKLWTSPVSMEKLRGE